MEKRPRRRSFPAASERRKVVIESFLKGALPQVIPVIPIARAELEHPIRIDMEFMHAAPAG